MNKLSLVSVNKDKSKKGADYYYAVVLIYDDRLNSATMNVFLNKDSYDFLVSHNSLKADDMFVVAFDYNSKAYKLVFNSALLNK